MNPPFQRPLVAVDWGTSALRGARFDPQGRRLEQRHFPRGILTVVPGEFPAVFKECFGDWMQDSQTLCLLSGMVGSRQGWQEAAYCPCPAGFAELGQHLLWLQPGRLAIVPGLSVQQHDGLPFAQHDVMRGEEVQIFGALSLAGVQDATVVLPGTHSKWAQVDNGRITSFQTFMTGEVFAALRSHTILARTLPALEDKVELDVPAFTQAVRHSLQSGHVLHQMFGTRTLALMARASPAELLSHLSGLLIGEELRAQQFEAEEEILIVGSSALQERYQHALAVCQVRSQCWGAQATWHGLQTIADSLT